MRYAPVRYGTHAALAGNSTLRMLGMVKDVQWCRYGGHGGHGWVRFVAFRDGALSGIRHGGMSQCLSCLAECVQWRTCGAFSNGMSDGGNK